MKAVSFASLVIRGVALWLVCNGIAGLSLLYLDRHRGDMVVVAILNGTILPIVTGIVIWSRATWLAGRMASSETDSAVGPDWTPAEALRVAVAVVGLVTLAAALKDIVWQASVYVSLHWLGSIESGDRRSDAIATANRASTLVRAIIGTVLVLKPTAIVSLVGRSKTEVRPDEEEAGGGGRTSG